LAFKYRRFISKIQRKYDIIIYQGHNIIDLPASIDLILPTVSPLEKLNTYANLEGKYQSTRFIPTFSPLKARLDSKIFVMYLIKLENLKLVSNTIKTILAQLQIALAYKLKEDVLTKPCVIVKEPSSISILPPLDCYLEDGLTKCSLIMFLVARKLRKIYKHFKIFPSK